MNNNFQKVNRDGIIHNQFVTSSINLANGAGISSNDLFATIFDPTNTTLTMTLLGTLHIVIGAPNVMSITINNQFINGTSAPFPAVGGPSPIQIVNLYPGQFTLIGNFISGAIYSVNVSQSNQNTAGSLVASLYIQSLVVPNPNQPTANVTINITQSGAQITARGVVFAAHAAPTLADFVAIDGGTSTGQFTMNGVNFSSTAYQTTFIRAYVTTANGTVYSANQVSFFPQLCLAQGTKITLANRTTKNIENIDYTDNLLVWNFDESRFDTAKPLWIAAVQTAEEYNLLKFNNGSELKTISQHRIFNKERGMFTYPMTDHTPIGTTTFSAIDGEIKLMSKEIIREQVQYYNIITNYHVNLFANSILTSCRYNNIYPILEMKFVKPKAGKTLHSAADLVDIPKEYVIGLRIAEQALDIEDMKEYIKRLEARKQAPAPVSTWWGMLTFYIPFYNRA